MPAVETAAPEMPPAPARPRSTTAERSVALFIAGHSGCVGRALLAQLETLAPRIALQSGVTLRLAALANRREVHWREGDETVPRRENDWPELLRRFRAEPGIKLFVDCSAAAALAALYPTLLAQGIGVVTPNKLAFSGPQASYRRLRELAQSQGVPCRYETTVGAALPLLSTLHDLLAAGDRVTRIEACLSGTLSFLFTRVNHGMPFSAALREARARGYTEPHPAEDLTGADSARKLLILLREAGMAWEPEQVAAESLVPVELAAETDAERFLAGLAAHDVVWAKRAEAAHHRNLRLAYLARFDGRSALAGVTHVAARDPFALLAPGENLVHLWTQRYQPVPLSIAGPGAGPELTAAGVLTDILKAAAELS